MDQEDARLRAAIREYGWSIEYIGGICSAPGCGGGDDDGSAFAYSVGLFGLDHPELMVFGHGPHDSAGLLNTLGDNAKAGESLISGMELVFEACGHSVITEELPNPGDIVFSANRFYRRPDRYSVPVLQLAYDDEKGRFPWDEGFGNSESQPRPGEFRA